MSSSTRHARAMEDTDLLYVAFCQSNETNWALLSHRRNATIRSNTALMQFSSVPVCLFLSCASFCNFPGTAWNWLHKCGRGGVVWAVFMQTLRCSAIFLWTQRAHRRHFAILVSSLGTHKESAPKSINTVQCDLHLFDSTCLYKIWPII